MTGINPDAELAREMRLTDRERKLLEERERARRRLERAQRAEQVRLEHERAMAQPLISHDLLTPEERDAIHARVRGRQRWHSPE